MYDKIKLLKSLGANYLVIKNMGYYINKPMAIITSGENIGTVIDKLSNFKKYVFSEHTKIKELEEALHEANSEYLFVLYSTTRRGKLQRVFFVEVMKMGVVGLNQVNAIPVIISDGRILRENIEDFFVIYLNGEDINTSILLEDIVPPDEKLEGVIDRIKESEISKEKQSGRALFVAAYFVYPQLQFENRTDEFNKLLFCAGEMIREDEVGSGILGLGQMFVDDLYNWQNSTHFHNVFPLPNLEMNVVNHIDSIILFDAENLYMSEQIFEDIAKSLLKTFPVTTLKSALVDEGILCPESEKIYSTKVNYRNIAGQYERIRMLRFKRSMLVRLGEIEFIECCICESKEKNYAD